MVSGRGGTVATWWRSPALPVSLRSKRIYLSVWYFVPPDTLNARKLKFRRVYGGVIVPFALRFVRVGILQRVGSGCFDEKETTCPLCPFPCVLSVSNCLRGQQHHPTP